MLNKDMPRLRYSMGLERRAHVETPLPTSCPVCLEEGAFDIVLGLLIVGSRKGAGNICRSRRHSQSAEGGPGS